MERSTSLFKVINGLRYFGVGSRVIRNNIKVPDSYWVVTRVKLSPDQNHGKVFGRLVIKGRASGAEEAIRSPLKKEWRLVGLPDYKTFTADNVDSLFPKQEATAL